jgi:hypothetical protein
VNLLHLMVALPFEIILLPGSKSDLANQWIWTIYRFNIIPLWTVLRWSSIHYNSRFSVRISSRMLASIKSDLKFLANVKIHICFSFTSIRA